MVVQPRQTVASLATSARQATGVALERLPSVAVEASTAVPPLDDAPLARGLSLRRDEVPCLAQVALERVIRDLIEQDADPPA